MDALNLTPVLILGLGALYFLPTFVAAGRHHHNTTTISILNFFLGWTFLGWVLLLGYAFVNQAPPRETPPPPQWHWAPGAEARSLAVESPPPADPFGLPYPDNAWRTFWLGTLYVIGVLGAVTVLIYLLGSTL